MGLCSAGHASGARGTSSPPPASGVLRGHGVRVSGPDPVVRRLPRVAWHGPLYCHVPEGDEVDLDALAEADGAGDRWNPPGRPTAYLASDPGVVLAEFGRHRGQGEPENTCRIVRLGFGPEELGSLDGLVDLRDPAVLGALAVRGAPVAFLDRTLARDVARRLRADPGCRGLVVPSMAFLDQPERCNVVVFADALPGGLQGVVRAWDATGEVRLSPTGRTVAEGG
jgi:RES domain-containing protein